MLICWRRYVEQSYPLADLVFFKELQLDRNIVSHPLVLLTVDLELLLGLLDLGHGGGITWPQIQLLQICAVCIILNPKDVTLFKHHQKYIMCGYASQCVRTHTVKRSVVIHPVRY